MELKSIFIQKEVPALVFPWQLIEIFNNNFLKEKKKREKEKEKKKLL